MNATELYIDTLNRSDSVLRRALEELTVEDLRKQPAGEGSNPIGWLVWHLSRARDMLVAGLSGQPTIWESDGWAARFGMEGNGPRFKPEDVHTFDPKDLATLTGYFEAVAQQTAAVVEKLTPDDLAKTIPSPVADRPPQTVGSRLSAVLNDNIQHIGQVAYLRGVLRGQGWF